MFIIGFSTGFPFSTMQDCSNATKLQNLLGWLWNIDHEVNKILKRFLELIESNLREWFEASEVKVCSFAVTGYIGMKGMQKV